MKKGGPGQLFTPFGITVLGLLVAIGCALWLAYLPWRWEQTKDGLRKRFPGIRRIDAEGPESLKVWLAKPGTPKPVLIDVRPQAEFGFSHLPGAKHMAISDTPRTLGFPETTAEPLVIYDAVGADAYPVAESLVKRGYAQVQVLEGGIFEWANRGLPLEGEAGATGRVQPGKSRFAGLLKRHAIAP